MAIEKELNNIKRLLLRVYMRYQSGDITEAQANKETQLLNSLLRAIVVTDKASPMKPQEKNLPEYMKSSPEHEANRNR